LQANGFRADVKEMPDAALGQFKTQQGVPPAVRSCHTAFVNGYVVEGHVPADALHRFLQKRPKVVGLAVPGMPPGSPGMESPKPQPYEIVTFDAAGGTTVFEKR
jgi:hypothetical protein